MIPYISNEDIIKLDISPIQRMDWIKESFLIKSSTLLPTKTSIRFDENKYFNTMPVVIPALNAMGVKVISRYPERTPTIDAQILLYDYQTGKLTCMLDAAKITEMRTGAACAVSVQSFAIKDFSTIAIMGLGNIARSSLVCILENNKNRPLTIKLYKYKDQAQRFIEDFKDYTNLSFHVCDSMIDFIEGSDVVISCITCTPELLSKPEWFKPGALLVPVHLKGFQNCDLAFDKIFVDDISHVSNFKYFKQYKNLGEISDVLSEKISGRENNKERIIVYSVGIAVFDIVFANHIVQLLGQKS